MLRYYAATANSESEAARRARRASRTEASTGAFFAPRKSGSGPLPGTGEANGLESSGSPPGTRGGRCPWARSARKAWKADEGAFSAGSFAAFALRRGWRGGSGASSANPVRKRPDGFSLGVWLAPGLAPDCSSSYCRICFMSCASFSLVAASSGSFMKEKGSSTGSSNLFSMVCFLSRKI